MKTINSNLKSIGACTALITAALSLTLASLVWAETRVGNGGGAWVCRENTGAIRNIRMVDLFEAENHTKVGINLGKFNAPGLTYKDIVGLAKTRLFESNRDLYARVAEQISKINNLEEQKGPPKITTIQDSLEMIDDALFKIRPGSSRCVGGQMNYEQVINYGNDGEILIQSELFLSNSYRANAVTSGTIEPNVSALSRAAFVLHEAIYAYRRATAGDKDSVMSRRIVGLIFSTLSVSELTKALEDLDEGEVPITGMSFAKIPSGSFMMGSPSREADRDSDETQHSMTIARSFEMMKTEVTQSQWFAMMGNNPSSFNKYENCPKTYVAPEKNKGIALCPNNPVETVSWDDIQQFLVKLNQAKHDGYFYRLPTEAEWEYAARGGTQSAYYWGSDSSQAFAYAWYDSSTAKMTHEVSSLKPNAYGLYDTAGNVWEWVSDYWASDYEKYPNGGPSSGSNRVFRGGSWFSDARYLRSAYRSGNVAFARGSSLGFRLARSQ